MNYDPYKVLGVFPETDPSEITRVYKSLVHDLENKQLGINDTVRFGLLGEYKKAYNYIKQTRRRPVIPVQVPPGNMSIEQFNRLFDSTKESLAKQGYIDPDSRGSYILSAEGQKNAEKDTKVYANKKAGGIRPDDSFSLVPSSSMSFAELGAPTSNFSKYARNLGMCDLDEVYGTNNETLEDTLLNDPRTRDEYKRLLHEHNAGYKPPYSSA